MSFYTKKILPDSFYHIYNRGNNFEDIFYSEKNYYLFLRNYNEFLSPYLKTYAYCLLPDHFHLVIKTNSNSRLVSEQFRQFFSMYAQKINERTGRIGSLFLKPFRRKLITDENYLRGLIIYVHYNPVYHNVTECYENYKWNSYSRMLIPKNTNLQKEFVLDLFGGRESYIQCHNAFRDFRLVREFTIEFTGV